MGAEYSSLGRGRAIVRELGHAGGGAAAIKSFGTDRPPDRWHRIEVFARAYGLPGTGGLVDEVIPQHHLMIAQRRAAALRGFEPVATRLARDDGMLRLAERQIASIESHRALFE